MFLRSNLVITLFFSTLLFCCNYEKPINHMMGNNKNTSDNKTVLNNNVEETNEVYFGERFSEVQFSPNIINPGNINNSNEKSQDQVNSFSFDEEQNCEKQNYEEQNHMKQTLFHAAVDPKKMKGKSIDLGLIRFFISQHPKIIDINQLDGSGKTGLDYVKKNTEADRILLSAGAYRNVDKQVKIAVNSDNFNKLDGLINKGADLDITFEDTNNNLLHQASGNGYFEISKILLKENSKLLNQLNKDTHTPLTLAISSKNIHLIDFLCIQGGLIKPQKDNKQIKIENYTFKINQQEKQMENLKLKYNEIKEKYDELELSMQNDSNNQENDGLMLIIDDIIASCMKSLDINDISDEKIEELIEESKDNLIEDIKDEEDINWGELVNCVHIKLLKKIKNLSKEK